MPLNSSFVFPALQFSSLSSTCSYKLELTDAFGITVYSEKTSTSSLEKMKAGIVRYQSYEVAKQLIELEKRFTSNEFIMYELIRGRWYHQDENTIVYVNSGIRFIDAMVGNLAEKSSELNVD